MIEQIDRRIRRALAGVRQAFRAVLTRVDSDTAVQLGQLDGLADETLQDPELFQHYGMTSNPPRGSMAIVLPLGGKTSHGIVIATEHATYRLKSLAMGEVALYTDEGDAVHLKRGRIIEVTTGTFRVNASERIELNAPEEIALNTERVKASNHMTAQGALSVNGGMDVKGGDGATARISGTLEATTDVVASGTSLHQHKHRGDSGGTTSEPI